MLTGGELAVRELAVGGPAGPLGLDQLGEPADLAVHRLEAVLLELQGVAVEA